MKFCTIGEIFGEPHQMRFCLILCESARGAHNLPDDMPSSARSKDMALSAGNSSKPFPKPEAGANRLCQDTVVTLAGRGAARSSRPFPHPGIVVGGDILALGKILENGSGRASLACNHVKRDKL
jgi:hypothetical protein